MTHAIRIQNLGKSYLLMHRAAGIGQYVKLSDVLVQRAKAALGLQKVGTAQDSRETFWALADVSFDVKHGERVGIIGRNGAGKSTLLKIISRISAPSRGRIEIAGRVSSLLEVGTGFHPELTGRENIFLNGAVLGMSRADIRQRFDEIVQFAEVERFLDTPVKRYSSGMYMRLAFAVAAHLEPDILIVDEVLAVGDAAFQKKCLGKMRQVGSEGRTVLFVSHNMGAISEFCSRAILLDSGCVAADGTPALIIPQYASAGGQGGGAGTFTFDDKGVSACHIRRVVIADKTGQSSGHFEMSGDISITVEYVVREYLPELQMTVTVSGDTHDVFHAFDNDEDQEIVGTQPGVYAATYTIPSMTLREGLYSLRVTGGVPTELLSDVSGGLTFEVVNHAISALKKSFRSDRTGIVVSPGHWKKSQIAELPESGHE